MYHPTDSTYHGLCYASRGALVGTRISSIFHHEGSIRRSIVPRSPLFEEKNTGALFCGLHFDIITFLFKQTDCEKFHYMIEYVPCVTTMMLATRFTIYSSVFFLGGNQRHHYLPVFSRSKASTCKFHKFNFIIIIFLRNSCRVQ